MLRDAVVVLIKDDFGRVLLARRSEADSFSGVWNPITGEVEEGESLVEACKRETHEETGLEIEVVRKVYESTTSKAAFVLHWFEAEVVGGELALDPEELDAARWVDGDSLPEVGLMFRDSVEFFERYFEDQ